MTYSKCRYDIGDRVRFNPKGDYTGMENDPELNEGDMLTISSVDEHVTAAGEHYFSYDVRENSYGYDHEWLILVSPVKVNTKHFEDSLFEVTV